jgi:hypothetical protein
MKPAAFFGLLCLLACVLSAADLPPAEVGPTTPIGGKLGIDCFEDLSRDVKRWVSGRCKDPVLQAAIARYSETNLHELLGCLQAPKETSVAATKEAQEWSAFTAMWAIHASSNSLPAIAPQLVSLYEKERTNVLRNFVANLLRHSGRLSLSAQATALEDMAAESPQTRQQGLIVLSGSLVHSEVSMDAILAASSDPSMSVRHTALGIIWEYRDDDPRLMERLRQVETGTAHPDDKAFVAFHRERERAFPGQATRVY